MSLVDRLTTHSEREPIPARRPRQYEPTASFDGAGQLDEVSLNVFEIPEDEAGWREAITSITGLDIPKHREVVLTQVRYWGPDDDSQKNSYCRFTIRDRDVSTDVDAVALLQELRKGARRGRPMTAPNLDTSDVVSWNDWQVGKDEGGGTEALAERLDRQFDDFLARRRDIPKAWRPGELVIVGGGDMIEGCEIFKNQAFTLDGDRRAQVNNTVAFILEGLDRWAPHYSSVRLLVVGGNHGEHRIKGKRTTRYDNDDCAVFEHAARAAARDDRLAHVEFLIAQEVPYATTDVQGWVLGTTHGQVFDRGAGGSIENKAYRWYSQQAAGRLPAGDADLLVTHHYHHEASADWGACRWQQTPANDGGSGHFTDTSGRYSEPGMLTWKMSTTERYDEPHILR